MEATGSICILPWDHWTHMRSWCSWCSCATLRSMPPDPNLRGINWGRLKPLSSSYGHPAHQAVPGLCPERKLPLPHILQCDDCHYSSKNGCTPKAQNSVTLGIHEYNPCFNMFQPSGCVCKCFFWGILRNTLSPWDDNLGYSSHVEIAIKTHGKIQVIIPLYHLYPHVQSMFTEFHRIPTGISGISAQSLLGWSLSRLFSSSTWGYVWPFIVSLKVCRSNNLDHAGSRNMLLSYIRNGLVQGKTYRKPWFLHIFTCFGLPPFTATSPAPLQSQPQANELGHWQRIAHFSWAKLKGSCFGRFHVLEMCFPRAPIEMGWTGNKPIFVWSKELASILQVHL